MVEHDSSIITRGFMDRLKRFVLDSYYGVCYNGVMTPKMIFCAECGKETEHFDVGSDVPVAKRYSCEVCGKRNTPKLKEEIVTQL